MAVEVLIRGPFRCSGWGRHPGWTLRGRCGTGRAPRRGRCRRRTRATRRAAPQLVGAGQGRLADPAAAPADDVQVGGVLGEVVAGGAVVDVGVPDETELLQRLERAVDRGGRHGAAAVGGHRLDEVVGSGVTEPADGGQHPLALRRQALAPRPQPLTQITHPANYASQRTPSLRTYTGRVTDQSLEPRNADTRDREHPEIRGDRRTRRNVKRALIVLTALILVVVAGVAGIRRLPGLHGQRQRHPRGAATREPAPGDGTRRLPRGRDRFRHQLPRCRR